MYKVVKLFTDLQDNNFKYDVGDEYPRVGLKPSLARIAELSGSDNRQGTPLIEEIVSDEPIPTEAVEDKAPAKKKTTTKRKTAAKKNEE